MSTIALRIRKDKNGARDESQRPIRKCVHSVLRRNELDLIGWIAVKLQIVTEAAKLRPPELQQRRCRALPHQRIRYACTKVVLA